jgi:hypothetical protein
MPAPMMIASYWLDMISSSRARRARRIVIGAQHLYTVFLMGSNHSDGIGATYCIAALHVRSHDDPRQRNSRNLAPMNGSPERRRYR